MKKLTLIFISAIFISAKAERTTIIPDFFPKIPPYEIVRHLIPVLEKASVVIIQREKDKPPFITGIVLINAPVDKVIGVVREYEKYHEFVPNVSQVKVMRRFPETGTQISEYNIGFNIALGLKFTITYTLEQTYLEDERVIFGSPAKVGKQVFGDVRYIEKYYDTGDGRTIMIYSAYADLASFGLLSKLVYRAFPELQIPSLVAVSTLFPEAVKERIEGKKLIVEPGEIDYTKVKIPERVNIAAILPLLRIYKSVVLSWYPDENMIRFFSSFFLANKDMDYIKSVITDFKAWPRFFKLVEKADPEVIPNGYRVKFELKYKIAFPIEIGYTAIYEWADEGKRLKCGIDRTEKRDIEGMLCVWDLYRSDHGTIIGYTEFSDLRTGSFFLKLLMEKVSGFGIGLRVALVSAFSEMLRKVL